MIFINYRNGPHATAVEAITERFRERFGRKNVFLDVQSILSGQRYPDELTARLAEAKVLIAVIHPTWSQDRDPETGQILISRDSDWVRREIAQAIRSGILVVPLMLGKEPLRANELPADLRDLAHRQVALLHHGSLDENLNRVMDNIAAQI